MPTTTPDTQTLRAETLEVSRRLGQDPFLVLHGGGNTSAKDRDALWAKASGFDLGQLTPEGLVELRREHLDELLEREQLSDIEMMNGYAGATVLPGQPAPTIEALLHHALPFPSVLHTHADAIVAVTDTARGLELPTELFGDEVLVVPYVMPGFDLAKLVPRLWREAGGRARAIVLQHHGLFTMGDTAEEAYALHLKLVRRAEAHIAALGIDIRAPFVGTVEELHPEDSAEARMLLDALQRHSTQPLHALRCIDDETTAFIEHPELDRISQAGPMTLEHVIRTKRLPLIGDDVAAYIAAYTEYFRRNRGSDDALQMLDPVPRVILHPKLGLVTTGPAGSAARVAMDIYRHTIRVIMAAERMGGYRTVSEQQAFGIEYWELEQRKLK